MSPSLVEDRKVTQAVSGVLLRSDDRETDYLSATFVDPGITDRLANQNSQILWGRRGTGKTHVFRVLERELTKAKSQLGIYVDLEKLGSAGMYNDARPAGTRALHLFRDLMSVIANGLLDYATRPETEAAGPLFDSQVAFARAVSRTILSDESLQHQRDASNSRERSAGMTVSPLSGGFGFSGGGRSSSGESESWTSAGRPEAYISFQEVNDTLSQVIHDGGLTRVYVFLDEWVAIPFEIQPLVAEFIKRTLLAERRVTVKIAAIEYRSNLGERKEHNNVLGFELGADIGSGLELDDYFVYDRNADKTLAMFGRLLYGHIAAEVEAAEVEREVENQLPEGSEHMILEWIVKETVSRLNSDHRYLTTAHGIADPDSFLHEMFVKTDVFRELVRAGEGVVRDFINIFALAFLDAQRRDLCKIDLDAVRTAAMEWYERDKANNATIEQREVLRRIVEEVIGQRRVRSFLLEKDFERDDLIRSLFDFRLLHLLHRGFVDSRDVGRRYNIYAIDYGAYVELLGSTRAPARDLSTDIQDSQSIVPFGDKRRMKRVVLDPKVLKAASPTAKHGA